jgi:uncharacterized protein
MSDIELIEVDLREIQASEGAGAQIMIFGETDGERQFPIFIGFGEMDALDRALHGVRTPRPMTHDLILNVMEEMGGKLRRVIISDLNDDTFFARLGVELPDGGETLVDARPSDAMVLGVRRRVPVFVARHVLEAIGKPPPELDFE